MRKVYFLTISVFLLISSNASAQCLNAFYGLYPSATFTPSACNGISQTITDFGWAGEYSNVNVIAGNEYTFTSSVSTDYITISDAGGSTAYAFGTTPVTWTATSSGTVRFYNHLSSACDDLNANRTRAVSCILPPCTGTPNSGLAIASPQYLCSAGSVDLSVTGQSTGSGLAYQWQSSPDNITYTDISGATAATYTVSVSANTWYRVVISCGTNSSNSTPVLVSLITSLSGSYNVGAGQSATGGFETLSGAVSAYSNACSITGNVIFNLTDASYSTSESFPIVINPNASAGVFTLTIKPATGVTASITGSSSSIIKINGADRVIIDGSNNNTDSRDLTITNNSTGGSAVIWVASLGGAGNGATNNIIRNVNIVGGSGTLSNIYGVLSSNTSSITTVAEDNDSLTIRNNSIMRVYTGISALNSSTSGLAMDGLQVTGNSIGSNTVANYVTNRGIEISNAVAPVIEGNTIFNIITPLANTNTATGINVGANVAGGRITRNNIMGVHQPNTGGWTAYGIRFEGSGTDNIIVSNNFISDVKTVNYSTTSTTWNAFGIGFNAGTNHKVYHNTINMYGPVTGGSFAGMSANLMVSSATVTGLDVRNNIFVNSQEFGISGSFAYNVFIGFTGNPFSTINYNDYYGSASSNTTYRVGYASGTPRTTLSDWQAYTTQDANSMSVAPVFMSQSDLHLMPGLNPLLNATGTPLTAVTVDIDMDPRDPVNPDLGADEFTPPVGIDITLTALLTPIVKDCYSATEGASVRIKNFSSVTHDFAIDPVTVTLNVTGAATTTLNATVNTGSLNPGDSLTVTFPGTVDMTAIGTYTFNGYSSVATDINPSNDTLATVTRTLVAPNAGTVSSSPAEICVSGTPALSVAGTAGGSIQWSQSSSASGPWTNVGTGASIFTPSSPITATTYYRVEVSCNANSATSAVYEMVVNDPQITGTTPAALCGPGSMTLQATGSAGTTINWYTSATGGVPIATGTSYTTPSLNATTTYYVSASLGGANVQAGLPNNSATYGTFGNPGGAGYGLYFTASGPFTIASVYVYPLAAGTSTIQLQDGTGAPIPGASVTATFTASDVNVKTLVPLNFVIPSAGSYRLMNTTGISLGRFNPYTGTFPLVSGPLSITEGSLGTTTYYSFFDWTITQGCETPRQAVTATVSPNTAILSQPVTQSVCGSTNIMFTVNAEGANLSYQWFVNGQPISGATDDTLILNNVTPGNDGNYIVEITGLCGTVTSQAANLTVAPGNSWIGMTSTDWHNAANWCGGVPTSTSDVFIPTGAPFYPIISGSAVAGNLTIHPHGVVTMQNGSTLNLHGNFTNNGTIKASSATIAFVGSSGQVVDTLSAGTIIINGAGITLAGHLTAENTLTLTSGHITLGVYDLNINGSVNGSVNSHIITNGTGNANSFNIGSNPVVIPVGPDAANYNPVTISNGQGRNYSVRVGMGVIPAITDNSRAVNRHWTVLANGFVANPVSISLQYADAHANTNASPSGIQQVGLYHNNLWFNMTGNGVNPTGTANDRNVTFQTQMFGPFVVSSPNGITFQTSITGIDPDINSVIMLPNLVTDHSVLRVKTGRASRISWVITDASGRVVKTYTQQLLAGTTDLKLDLGQLSTGSYQVNGYTDRGRTQSIRFIKL